MVIAFVTSQELPHLDKDDLLATTILQKNGVHVHPAIWNDPGVSWQKYKMVVLRSCWDYHLHSVEFEKWIKQMQKDQIPLFNSPKTILWNFDKIYLQKISQQGIATVETVWVDKNAKISLEQILKERNWQQAVVKPRVSLSAYETWRISVESAPKNQQRFTSLLQSKNLMVQKFAPQISKEGEWSFVFFNGVHSHCVLKKPKKGDFRVQDDFGGTKQAIINNVPFLKEASACLALIEKCLYARIDGVVIEGKFTVMEIELIDPSLYLSYSKMGAKNFAQAIIEELAKFK